MISLVELKEGSKFISKLFVVCLIWGLSSLVVLDFYVEVCIITHGHFQDLSCNQTVHHFGQNISLQ